VGPHQADSYIDAIRDVCYALAKGTKNGKSAEVLTGFMKYFCGSHVVYFLESNDHLDVIRILHQRQDAERHL
jgi:toxin ParE1/3/4